MTTCAEKKQILNNGGNHQIWIMCFSYDAPIVFNIQSKYQIFIKKVTKLDFIFQKKKTARKKKAGYNITLIVYLTYMPGLIRNLNLFQNVGDLITFYITMMLNIKLLSLNIRQQQDSHSSWEFNIDRQKSCC